MKLKCIQSTQNIQTGKIIDCTGFETCVDGWREWYGYAAVWVVYPSTHWVKVEQMDHTEQIAYLQDLIDRSKGEPAYHLYPPPAIISHHLQWAIDTIEKLHKENERLKKQK